MRGLVSAFAQLPNPARIFTCTADYTIHGMSIDWPHAPVHRLDSAGAFMVTAATLHKEHLFGGSTRLTSLQDSLLSLAKQYDWQLEAWSVFSNHYHFVARGDGGVVNLKKLLTHLHAETAREINKADSCPG